MKLKIGEGNYEGKAYTYIYVDVVVNGLPVSIRLKCSTSFEKELLINEIKKNDGGGEK